MNERLAEAINLANLNGRDLIPPDAEHGGYSEIRPRPGQNTSDFVWCLRTLDDDGNPLATPTVIVGRGPTQEEAMADKNRLIAESLPALFAAGQISAVMCPPWMR